MSDEQIEQSGGTSESAPAAETADAPAIEAPAPEAVQLHVNESGAPVRPRRERAVPAVTVPRDAAPAPVTFRRAPVVAVGEPDDGWGAFVMQSLGLEGDEYTEAAAELVREAQLEAGLDPDGVVAGYTWALVLPVINKDRARGMETVFLRRLLGLRSSGRWNAEVDGALGLIGEEVSVIDRDTWLMILAADAEPAGASSSNTDTDTERAPS